MSSSTFSSESGPPDGIPWYRHLRLMAAFLLFLFVLDAGIGWFLQVGLERYFGMRKATDVVCVGHSRTILGIDADLLAKKTGLTIVVYAVNGANTVDRYAMVQQFLSEHPETRLLIYDVDTSSFTSENLSSNSYRLFFPFIGNIYIGAYLRENCRSPDEYWLRRICRSCRYNEVTLWLAVRGWFGFHKNLKWGKFDPRLFERQITKGKTRPLKVEPEQYCLFMKSIEFATRRGVRVLLVNMPNVDILNVRNRNAQEDILKIFRKLAESNHMVLFADYSQTFESQYDLFYDSIHLNGNGQHALTELLANYLNQAGLELSWKQSLASH